MDANQNGNPDKKTYHKKATGAALETVESHSEDHELKLFGSCFCPFVQRVWISLELKRLDYQYIELEDLHEGEALLPSDPKLRAYSRLWSDHIEHAEELKGQMSKLVDAADQSGPFFLGDNMSFVDVQIAPWIIRLRKVLQPYRGWPEPEAGTRWAKWVDAIEQNHAVKATTSTDELYLDSYERYAENRPNTSEVQKAINSGKGLP
ncbi:glutathione S-transferase [Aureobasidium subglaciale]|nr:glutathione S-transferase [Aureobasidium subglaciale]KAI5228426.1 glutathione S-transferase [Aureobasidium subglaciale]KAI5231972.1 glutathione S-transferase [Aureobasidium subglaciale]KAI5265777.1 glutathione S-transferase [Aureobasidium subglaciale]